MVDDASRALRVVHHGDGLAFLARGRLADDHAIITSLPDHSELVGGEFWTGDIARHDRLRLAYTVWSVLSRRLLVDG